MHVALVMKVYLVSRKWCRWSFVNAPWIMNFLTFISVVASQGQILKTMAVNMPSMYVQQNPTSQSELQVMHNGMIETLRNNTKNNSQLDSKEGLKENCLILESSDSSTLPDWNLSHVRPMNTSQCIYCNHYVVYQRIFKKQYVYIMIDRMLLCHMNVRVIFKLTLQQVW